MVMDQNRMPIYEALQHFKTDRIVPFDVPGHKRGKGNKELTDFLGEKCLTVDVNSMKPLDNLCHPVSVIRDAEILAADAFGAANAFLWLAEPLQRFKTWSLLPAKREIRLYFPEMSIEVL